MVACLHRGRPTCSSKSHTMLGTDASSCSLSRTYVGQHPLDGVTIGRWPDLKADTDRDLRSGLDAFFNTRAASSDPRPPKSLNWRSGWVLILLHLPHGGIVSLKRKRPENHMQSPSARTE